MTILILLIALLQLITAAAVLKFGGEYSSLEAYSYNVLVERTGDRGTYFEEKLCEKAGILQDFAPRVEALAAGSNTMGAVQPVMADLLARAGADEVYLILDTGDDAGTGLYLSAAGDGGKEVAFAPDPEDRENFDFYYTPLETARENSGAAQNGLGYWSGFSKVTDEAEPSMKYTLPLIGKDGTAYGVLGVGFTSDSIFFGPSAKGLTAETACYVLARCLEDDRFEVLGSSGADYSALLGTADTLHISGRETEDICSFDTATGADVIGSVVYIDVYGPDGGCVRERWALICAADRASVLQPVLFLRRMLVSCALLSLIVAAIVAVPGCSWLVKPLSALSKRMKAKRKYNEVIRFEPSNVYEIDEITDAITRLQINIQGFSSQVSKMISVADVGLGTFMYDRTDDSVFVGQSLIKVLGLNLPQGEDIVMSRKEFLSSIENPEIRSPIAAGLGMSGGRMQGDFSEVYQISQPDGSTFWMRLGYTYSQNTAIGSVQDITETMIERNRIAYERDYDTLTGLLTRYAYYRRLSELFADKSKLGVTAFVMIDLDNLKYVNDTYGHDFGDDYIRTAANALAVFGNHGGIVARISGDEFNICLPGFSSKQEVREIIAGVRTELLQSSCLLADGTHFKVSASMGVSWYPDDADSYELLMKYADFAMYTIKHSTKGEIAEFDVGSYSTDSVLLTGVEEMNRIIKEVSVQYAFQSIVSVKTGEIYGYEALMRVQSKIFRTPLELLRAAKTGAKLHEIERLTWTKALADFQALLDSGSIAKDAHLFVNSIANHTLDAESVSVLEKTYPQLLDRIIMEILESENAAESSISRKIQRMQVWGAQLALDDFGTGYNSEFALLNLKPNIIKIDRSITAGCDKDADRRMIIENLVKLGRAKGVLVLAEGVETQEEMETVILSGVDFLQGYYLAHPVFEPKPIDPQLAETIRRLAKERDAGEKGK